MIRRLVLTVLSLLLLLPLLATAGSRVRGYTRRDGIYVPPHARSAPDQSRSNNWSTRGNVNPYTGERGTRTPAWGIGRLQPLGSYDLPKPPWWR